jgi:hypothetical protein
MKVKYPSIPSSDYYWIKSRSFANGNAIDIYLNHAPADFADDFRKEIESSFEYGNGHSTYGVSNYRNLKSKTDEGERISYGAKYIQVSNLPPYNVIASVVDWSVLSNPTAPVKANTSKPFTRKSSSSSGSKFDRGMMIKECAGWEIYKKDYGKNVLYSAVKKPETPKNKTDWDIIKGEIYTESGFSYKFSSLQKYGLAATITPQIEELCKILSKYYQSSSPAPTITPTTAPTTQPANQYGFKKGSVLITTDGTDEYNSILDVDFNSGMITFEIGYFEKGKGIIFQKGKGIATLKESPNRPFSYINEIQKGLDNGELKVLYNIGDEFIAQSSNEKIKIVDVLEKKTFLNWNNYPIHYDTWELVKNIIIDKTIVPLGSSANAPTTTTPTTLTKEKIDTLIKGLDVLIKRGNAQAELKKKAYLIIRNRLK